MSLLFYSRRSVSHARARALLTYRFDFLRRDPFIPRVPFALPSPAPSIPSSSIYNIYSRAHHRQSLSILVPSAEKPDFLASAIARDVDAVLYHSLYAAVRKQRPPLVRDVCALLRFRDDGLARAERLA